MPVPIANTDINSVGLYYLINRVNELAWTMSNNAVTTDTTATGNAAVSNVFSANSFTAGSNATLTSTKLTFGNSTVNSVFSSSNLVFSNSSVALTVQLPTAAQVSAGYYYLNANSGWGPIVYPYNPISNNAVTTTGTSAQLIDSYLMASSFACKYLISVKDNNANNFYSSVIHTMHDTASAYIDEYSMLISNSSVGTFTANANSTAVRLYFTPSSSNTTVKFTKTIV